MTMTTRRFDKITAEGSEMVERVAAAIRSELNSGAAPWYDPDRMQRVARAAIAAMAEPWRTIDSAPKDGTPVLINFQLGFGLDHYDGPLMCVCWTVGEDGWQGGASQVPTFRATAWRPLPSPPES